MKNKFNGENLIFVGGVPRSGTTLVQNILDSHPDIHGLPEYTILNSIMRLRNKFRGWIDDGSLDTDLCSKEDIDLNFRMLVQSFLKRHIDKTPSQYVSEKSPSNILVFPELIEMFPKAHFIFVVREPRAVISSLLKVRKKALLQNIDQNLIKYTEQFNGVVSAINFNWHHLNNGFEAVRKDSNKILVVVYKNLVCNTEYETKRICEYLHLSWSDQMTRPSQFKHPGERNMTNEKNAPWYDLKMYNRDPETKEIDKWKSNLKLLDQIRIAKAFQGNVELENLGYDFSLDYLTADKRMIGQAQLLVRESLGKTRKSVKRFLNTIL